ncbi:MAG: SusC/RagA family TonB-linked outer membrane protein, partial [Bacteroidales bacterium]|nr:SusC/RagA family TonB-linked outer membrane protein [Bacteroidales bacterium]
MRKFTTILLFLLAAGLQGTIAQIPVTGRVTKSSDNTPLTGVTVLVKGTNVGNITDADGRYSITVPNNQAILQFSFIGFTPKEVTVGSQTTINVALDEALMQMDEVVVTALGISRESKSPGYAIATVDSKVLMESRALNVAQSLDGRVAGLNIN